MDALRSGLEVREVFVAPDLDVPDVTAAAREANAEIVPASESVLAAVSQTTAPQGIAAVARIPRRDLVDIVAGTPTLVVVLDEVRDPGNAGTLIRSAAGAAASGVVFTRGAVDPWNPKTVRAAAGAMFGLPLVTDVDLAEAVQQLRSGGLAVLGTATEAATSIYDADLARPIAFVFGNEAWGVSDEHVALLDDTVRIPMPGPLESLNVGIAGSIALFEAVRQRTAADPVYPRGPDA